MKNNKISSRLLKIINNFPPEVIRDFADGKRAAGQLLSDKEQKTLGALIDPDYPRFVEIYDPVRDAECRMQWTEWEMFFKLGWAFGLRHKPTTLKCARILPEPRILTKK